LPIFPFCDEGGIVKIDDESAAFLKAAGKGTDLSAPEFGHVVVAMLEQQGRGKKRVTYKLRDWIFSRQRYWGEPIPLLHREDGSIEPVVDPDDLEAVREKLPLMLPEVADYLPSSDGSSPLAKNKEWV